MEASSIDQVLHFPEERLIEFIEKKMQEGEHELIQQLVDKKITLEPTNLKLVVLKANLLIDMGHWDQGYELLISLLQTEEGQKCAEVYMGLAQMTTELDSVQYYTQGLDIYLKELKEFNGTESGLIDLKRKISDSFIALTELYLTDLCFEPDAEKRCENYLSQAIQIDNKNSIIYQTLASVRLSQHREEEAKECLLSSFNLWYNKPEVTPPIYQTRSALARMFIETSMMEEALQVLEHLNAEDNSSVETWYLFGLCNYLSAQKEEELQNEDEASKGFEYYKDSWECLLTASKLANDCGYDDYEVLKHIEELKMDILARYPGLENHDLEEEKETGDGENLEEVDFYTDEEEEEAME
ncbi:hypothetical protein K502DRAFT_325247 [Neoconidiobolus thromboides FSU 785]|nr:hypothetical protein K502DRAFT_325247 [Neoconidiobolus thromboides FSU 785]